MTKDTQIVTDKFNFNNYTFEDLVESKIYSNYSTLNTQSKYQDILNVEPQKNEIFVTEYLIKNKLPGFEYIVELYFNRIDDVSNILEPFNRIGTFDIITKEITYKIYSLITDSNLVWKASYGNALVGFDLIYDDTNIKKIRIIEAPIDKMHDMPHNISFSKWYGVRNEIEKDMHNYKKMMIYVPNLFISGFQQIFYSSFISFGRVYFKAGPEIIKHKLDLSKCCIYDDETIEHGFCKYMSKLGNCSEKDNHIAIKNKINKHLKRMNNEKLNINSIMKCYDNVSGINNLDNKPKDNIPEVVKPEVVKSTEKNTSTENTSTEKNTSTENTSTKNTSTENTSTENKSINVEQNPKPKPKITKPKIRKPKIRKPKLPFSRKSRSLSSIERFADNHPEHFVPFYSSCSTMDKITAYLYVIGFYALIVFIIYSYIKNLQNKSNTSVLTN